MAATPWPPLLQPRVDEINDFRVWRGQLEQDVLQIAQYYRRVPYPGAGILPARAPPLVPVRVRQPLQPPAVTVPNQAELRWVKTDPEGIVDGTFTTKPSQWRGSKFLGRGSFARCGLWEYTGRQRLGTNHIVLKDSRLHTYLITGNVIPGIQLKDMTGEYAPQFARNVSEHSVTVFRGWPRDGTPMIILFLEYLPLGDMEELVSRRQDM